MSGKYLVASLASAACLCAPVVQAKGGGGGNAFDSGVYQIDGVYDVTAFKGDTLLGTPTHALRGINGKNDFEDDLIQALSQDPFNLDPDLEWIVGKTEPGDGDSGPFDAFPEELTTGKLTFKTAPSGAFAISLKASTFYSIYYFDEDTFAGATSIQFNTFGVAVKGKGQPIGPGLSHATLLTTNNSSPVVPSPTAALATGLMLAGLAMRRRRRA